MLSRRAILEQWSELHEQADQGDAKILDNPLVGILKDKYGRTPLHHLASKGIEDCLNHPLIGIVKDDRGFTPIHYFRLTYKRG